MSGLYDSTRTSRIQKIVPAFSEHAEPGDKILLGLEGDDFFPASYRSNRPELTVTRKVKVDENTYDVYARDKDGLEVPLRGNSVDPRYVWEFNNSTFERVLERQQARYRNSAVEKIDTSNIETRLNTLERNYRTAVAENTRFRNATVEAMSAMAGEVSSMGNAPFCKMLDGEYRSSMNTLKYRGSVLDDYSSSDEE